MVDTRALTVINNSQQNPLDIAVFAHLPTTDDGSDLAWIVQPSHGGTLDLRWDVTWGFAWSASGAEAGVDALTGLRYSWTAHGKSPADPTSDQTCSITLDYSGGAFEFTPGTNTADDRHLWISETAQIPEPDQVKSSVGVTVDGRSTCAVPAGPNLAQTFTAQPEYYIAAGQYAQGQIVARTTVTTFQQLLYTTSALHLTAIFNADNTWTVRPWHTDDANTSHST